MSSVVTRTGDGGTTDLYGIGNVSKSATRVHAYGDIDELNAVIGVVLTEKLPDWVVNQLHEVQRILFRLGADLAAPSQSPATVPRMEEGQTEMLEKWINEIEKDLPKQTTFILPGGCKAASELHLARTICRRTERWVVALHEQEKVNPFVLTYLNRLSDYLYVLSRKLNLDSDEEEIAVTY